MDEIEKLVKEFGAKRIGEKLREKLRGIHSSFARGLWVTHRELDKALSEGDFWIVSGRGPSEKIHFAHLLIFDAIRAMQEHFGVRVFIPVSDDEKFLFGKAKLEDVKHYGVENLKQILALGFDPELTYVMIDTRHMHAHFYEFCIRIAEKITGSTAKDVLGLKDSSNIGEFFYPAVQCAHILYPTLLTGSRVIVPIGADQDPYVRLSRDVAPYFNLKKPGAIHFRYIRGLGGEEKMSASQKESALYLEGPKQVKRKIWRAFTGGRATVEEQREFGGEPEKCVVFEYLSLLLDEKETEKLKKECMSGQRICGECKEILTELVNSWFSEIRKKAEKIRLEEFKVLGPGALG